MMLTNIQIEEGTATEYEPYQENILNIDLQGNELCSLPNNVKDELVIENGRAKIIKREGKVVINGSENFISRVNEYICFIQSDVVVINCYNVMSLKTSISDIISKHDYYLNTDGVQIRKDKTC